MNCATLQPHYESFALGAIEGEEYAEIQAHLARGCPLCTAGVEQARVVVAQLAALAPQVDPPASVRKKLMAAVSAEQRPARRGFPVLAWVAAAAMLAIALVSFVQLGNLRHDMAALERRYEEMAAENASYQRVWGIIAAPGTRAVSLASPDSPQIQAYWNELLGLVLAAQNMPPPAAGRTFQLWIVPKQGDPISVDIFRPDATGRTLLVAAPSVAIEEAAALAISDEPAGGSPQPTTTPIWVGPLG